MTKFGNIMIVTAVLFASLMPDVRAACPVDDNATSAEEQTSGTTMEARRPSLVPGKAGRKGQGREGGEKKRRPGKNWKPFNGRPPSEPPPHTPSQKD
jgi:hypothetical protein